MERSAVVIQWKPADVAVSDDRGTVPGALVECGPLRGTVIPPEGDSLDCWLESALCEAPSGVAQDDWVRAMEHAASEGARGEGGSDTLAVVESDDEKDDEEPAELVLSECRYCGTSYSGAGDDCGGCRLDDEQSKTYIVGCAGCGDAIDSGKAAGAWDAYAE